MLIGQFMLACAAQCVCACSGDFEHVASVDTRKSASSTLAASMLYIGYQIGYAASGFTIIAVRHKLGGHS